MTEFVQARKLFHDNDEVVEPEEDLLEEDFEVELPDAPPAQDNQLYTVMKGGERLFDISRKVGIPARDLIEHNGLDEHIDPYNLEEDFILHLPVPQVIDNKEVTYELLMRPTVMHVSNDNGAKKWSFGNVKTWDDIRESGPTYAFGHNVTVYAVAKVPVGDESAAYYMDAASLGNYIQTGRVAFMTGFNHSHLTEGFMDSVPKKMLSPEIKDKIEAAAEQQLLDQIAADAALENDKVAEKLAEPEPTADPNAWKTTFQPFERDLEGNPVPVMHTVRPCIVTDLAGEKRSIRIEKVCDLPLVGTFIGPDGEMYYRHADSLKRFNFYGIPESYVELYNYDVPLVDRVALGTLTPQEKYVTVPLSKVAGKYEKIRLYVERKINNK